MTTTPRKPKKNNLTILDIIPFNSEAIILQRNNIIRAKQQARRRRRKQTN